MCCTSFVRRKCKFAANQLSRSRNGHSLAAPGKVLMHVMQKFGVLKVGSVSRRFSKLKLRAELDLLNP